VDAKAIVVLTATTLYQRQRIKPGLLTMLALAVIHYRRLGARAL